MASDGNGSKFFLKRYAALGERVSGFELKRSIRVNTLKISQNEIVKRLSSLGVELKKIPFVKDGFWIEKSRFSLGAVTECLLGYYHLQEAASQIPAEILNPQEDDIVLDMAASPGGKTAQLSAIMKNKGAIVSLELKLHRLVALKTNLERLGVKNVVAYLYDARDAPKLGIQFDKILLDAPCSGNFIGDADWFTKRDLAGIQRSSDIQRGLLKAAVASLKKGGTLVYSTCSLEPEEDELNIQWLLDNFGDEIKLEETGLSMGSAGLTSIFGKKLNAEIAKCIRFWPNKTGTQGFFVAKARKK